MRFACLWLLLAVVLRAETVISISGEDFRINGRPTFEGRKWEGHRIEGLLPNSRMVQATFDDRNPATLPNWRYPDTKAWDAERNVSEFIAAMPDYRKHGLLAITVNLQGGSPFGYSGEQAWHNSGIEADGSLNSAYLARMERVIAKTDELGMAVILGVYYFGQDQRIEDEAAVIRGVEDTVRWVLGKGWRNVLLEINNEANVRYDHEILKPGRVHELIRRAKAITRDGRRLLVSTSFGGGTVPTAGVIEHADFLLIHGNGVRSAAAMRDFIARVKKARGDRGVPIVVNEDDHFDFDQPDNNFVAATAEHVSWGYFDYRMKGEGFDEGYQSVPVNWGLSSSRKRGFFKLSAEMTGSKP
jgi:hypothetical protein